MLKKSMSIPSAGFWIHNFHTTLVVLMVMLPITRCQSNAETMPWWTDPCKQKIPPISIPMYDKLRHGRSAGKENRGSIRNQLNILLNLNKENLHKLRRLYSKNKGVDSAEGLPSWFRAEKKIRVIQATRGYYSKLKKLHIFLQHFGGILEMLSHIKLQTNAIFNKTKRDDIIRSTKLGLKAFICEVKDALDLGKKKTKNILLKDMHIPFLEQYNLTKLHDLDILTLRTMKVFLRQVKRKILYRRKRNGKKRKIPESNNVPSVKTSTGRPV